MPRAADAFLTGALPVTHDPTAAAYADRVIFLLDGRLVHELVEPNADEVLDTMKALDSYGA